MVPVLVFDLETVPDVEGLRRLRPAWRALGDREVAQQAFAERAERTGSEFLALHCHRIVAIGCAFRDDREFRVRCLGQPGDDEGRLVNDFFRVIERYTPQLVSWNGTGFDLPVLHYRAMIHGIVAARYWEQGDSDRDFRWNSYLGRYHARHLDLMDVLSAYQGRAAAPLDELSRLCGFAGKLGMDGSKVWDAFCDGGIESIRAYCETDVVNTYLLYCRFQRMRGILDPVAYDAEVDVVRDSLRSLAGDHWSAYLAAWPPSPATSAAGDSSAT
ncbi:MAG TPA: 3'-5' exonuclease [Burkholderiaceae bacterium]|nr:3'-5' exonuclease [Burkholderiaceae bacterium]